MDHFLGAEMVTYEILIAAEEQDRDVFEEGREEGDCGG